MTEIDLKRLNELPVPAPRENAKRAARAAALEAFNSAEDKKALASPKEVSRETRLTSTPHPAVRRKFMQFSRSHYAMAASLAALIVAAPIAFRLLEVGPLPDFRSARPSTPIPLNTPEPDSGGEKNGVGDLKPKLAEKSAGKPATSPTGLAGDNKRDLGTQITNLGRSEGASPADAAAPAKNRGLIEKLDKDAAAGEQKQAALETPAPVIAQPAKPTEPAPLQITVAPPPESAAAVVGGADLNLQTGGQLYATPNAAISSTDARKRMEHATSLHDTYDRLDDAERQQPIAEQEHRDKFEAATNNSVKQVASEPVSTFSIDVDTASYAFIRRALNQGRLPPKDAVRVEEMINYFPYSYPRPETAGTPFQPTVTVLPSPWNTGNQLVHIGIKGYELQSAERPRANLVFLMDVSGSMQPADRLPLVKNAFRMLVDELKPDDTVAIVTYASGSGVLLEPTKISDKPKIMKAIDQLGAGGSTAGAEGIQDAYRIADSNFDKSAVNRVILATDGDFNVGVTDPDDLKGLIERKREKGIFLSILGVGEGNYNDALMQTLAQNGNGTAAYVDTLNEARKVLIDEASSTLFTIAKDVKIQVEWNPARVSEYRLVGYETRALKREDFNNDKVDAGDIGSGHAVTAIYEVTPAGAAQKLVDDLRYGKAAKTASADQPESVSPALTGELGFLKMRYKLPKEDASKLTTLAISDALSKDGIDAASEDTRFSVAVAAFGQLLKGAPYTKGYSYDDVIALAQSSKGADPFGYRAEFINLVRLAKSAQP